MEFDISKIVFERSILEDIPELLHIIHRCLKEVNAKDYESWQVERFLKDIILNRHFYTVKYGVLNSKLIEIPSSTRSHEFYHKLGYEYRSNTPIFKEDGSTIMYKYI